MALRGANIRPGAFAVLDVLTILVVSLTSTFTLIAIWNLWGRPLEAVSLWNANWLISIVLFVLRVRFGQPSTWPTDRPFDFWMVPLLLVFWQLQSLFVRRDPSGAGTKRPRS